MASKYELFEGATDRATFHSFTPVTLRFGDTDGMGHINNAVYATLFESGRFSFFGGAFDQAAATGRLFTLAKLTINFLVELHFPGTVDVGSRILSVGKSSVMMGHAIFRNDQCHAISDSVLVLIDTKTRKPTAMTPDIMQLVGALSQRLCV